MADARRSKERPQVSSAAALAGILTLLVEERETRVRDDKEAPKTEVLLDWAGLSLDDIAAVTGRNYNAVRMALSRSRRR